MLLNAAMAPKKMHFGHNEIETDGIGADVSAVLTHEEMIKNIAQNRDKACFADIFEYFAPRVKSFLMKGGSTPEQAEELAQETMLTVWHRAASFDPTQASASTWIFTIARNKKIDVLRKLKRQSIDSLDTVQIEDETPLPPETMMRAEEVTTIGRALKQLPAEQADLIRKSFFEDKSHAQIAQETGIPLGTIKSRIRLALQRLRHQEKVKTLWQ
jgi:RNA polymerase sigma-70 factor (ECF subfamily)